MQPFPPPQTLLEVIPYEDIDQRRQALFGQVDGWLRRRLWDLEESREERWQRDYSSLEAYERSVEPNRERWLQFLTTWDEPRCPLQPEVEPLREYDLFRLDRVWLQVRPGLRMDCLQLTPHEPLRTADGRAPGVICQHGMNGTPEGACGLDPMGPESGYNYAGVRLAEAGFVVVAPHEVGGYGVLDSNAHYIGDKPRESRYGARNYLHRIASLLGINLLGMDLYHVSRAIDYLADLTFVNEDHLGFYGLSQGGQSALWLPAADTRLKATVSAAYFNHRLPKMIDSGGENYTSYIDAAEEDRFYWGQLREFSDWQIVSLTCPRAFMVEAGREDKAAYWPMVIEEFDRSKIAYEKLGVPKRIELCLHDLGHINRAIESLAFLKRWLVETPLSASGATV